MKNLVDGLLDLSGFSHIYLIYHFHRSEGFKLKVTPFLDNQAHGVFATRAPMRPNQIGISVVKLLNVRGNILEIENVDILDGTPLLDIKPYIPAFDIHETEKCGWMENNTNTPGQVKSDDRFK
jgi:tRNA (adenine37-N6)-methyltransferase